MTKYTLNKKIKRGFMSDEKKPTSTELHQALVNKYAFIGFKKHVIKLEELNIENALKEADTLDKQYIKQLELEKTEAKEISSAEGQR